MAFLHCHGKDCNWSQDDFWSKDGYNPFRQDLADYLRDSLFQDKIYLDKFLAERIVDGPLFDMRGEHRDYYVSGTELVAYKLEMMAKSIRNMAVKTDEEWQKVRPQWKCPECGSSDWDID